jgi:PAS domain S-box-containing protein
MTRKRVFPARGSGYSKLFQDASVGIFRADVSGRILDLNPVCARMFGYDLPEHCISLDLGLIRAFCDTSDRSGAGLEALFEEKGHGYIEKKFTQKDGTRFLARVSLVLNTGYNGYLPHVEGFIEKVGHRKEVETALAETAARLKSFVNAFKGFIYTSTREYKIDFMNRALVERTGHDATGQFCHSVLHGFDRPCPWCRMDAVFRGETLSWEVKSPLDGRWYYCMSSPELKNGRVERQCSTIIDITDRKRREKNLLAHKAFLEKENLYLKKAVGQTYRFGNLVGKSVAMQSVYSLIAKAGATGASVIVQGESGTGKELVARAIHELSDRKEHNFVPVNCSAIPVDLIESEFFGYKKGAFSNADRDKQGVLDVAHKGTLFLDEIGDIGLTLQGKLLRAIDGGGYSPVGSTQVKKNDFRIVGATNKNLLQLVEQGLMRSDFYFRIQVLSIHLPPLRDRKEDIPLLVDYFGDKMPEFCSLPGNILERFHDYHWPGNVRELQNVLNRYHTLNVLDFLEKPENGRKSAGKTVLLPGNSSGESLRTMVNRLEKQVILDALKENQWHRTRVASLLGIDRKTLAAKIKSYGLIRG